MQSRTREYLVCSINRVRKLIPGIDNQKAGSTYESLRHSWRLWLISITVLQIFMKEVKIPVEVRVSV